MVYHVKVCQADDCSEQFNPKSPTSKYCSEPCKRKMRHLLQLVRSKKNLEKKLEAKCAYPECESIFIPKHGKHIYCHTQCKSKNKIYGQRLEDKPAIQCAYKECGKSFKRTNANQICCSDECKSLRLSSPELSSKRYPQGYFKPKQCRNEGCGETFTPRAPSQHYCSEKCKGYNSYYMRQYGITQHNFDEMKADQGGVCYLCGSDGFVIGKLGHSEKLAVDHCHETGVVRKLLCHNCNRGLGLFQDNPELLDKAAKYLKLFK